VLNGEPSYVREAVVDTVGEHQTRPSRKVMRIQYEAAGEAELPGDPNPFEGE